MTEIKRHSFCKIYHPQHTLLEALMQGYVVGYNFSRYLVKKKRMSQEPKVVFQIFTSFSFIQNTILQNTTYFVKQNRTVQVLNILCLSVCLLLSLFLLLSLSVKRRIRVLDSGGLHRRIMHHKYCHLILKESKMKPTENNGRIWFLDVVLNADDRI